MRSFLTGWLILGGLLFLASHATEASDVYHQRTNSFYTYGVPNSNYVGSPYTSLSTSPQLAPLYFQGGTGMTNYSSGYGGYVTPAAPLMPAPIYGPGYMGPGYGVGAAGYSYGRAPVVRGYSPAFRSSNFAIPRGGGGGFRRR